MAAKGTKGTKPNSKFCAFCAFCGYFLFSARKVTQYNAGMKRREFLSTVAGAGVIAASPIAASSQTPSSTPRKGRLKQSVMASVWGQSQLSFEERCKTLARIGFKGVDLPTAQQIPILRDNGLTPALMTGTGTSFQNGLIRKEMHAQFEEAIRKGIDMCVELGCPNL